MMSDVAKKPVKRSKRKVKDNLISWLMILPAVEFLGMFVIYPVINMIRLSFYKGNAAKPMKQFVGLDNYEKLLFVKEDFWVALKNTAFYTVAMVVLLIVLSVLFAQWMYSDRRLNRVAQTAFFTPHLVSSLSCAFIFSWLLNSNSYGLINSILGVFGIGPIRWLDSTNTAMWSVIIMNTWKSIGYYALIVLSAMKSIPLEIYEAAKLDNSSSIRTFFKITLPMLSPQLFFLLITIMTGSFKVFDSIRIMTNGGPGTSTEVISMYIYEYAFVRNNSLGYACAAGVVMLVILMVLTALNFGKLEKKVHYQ